MFNDKKTRKNEVFYGKVPPNAIEIEDIVIGCLLTESKTISTVKEILNPEDFYKEENKCIYEAIYRISETDIPDMLLIANYLKTNGKLEFIGGLPYISHLISKVTSSANIKKYCLIIKQKSVSRKLILITSDALSKTLDDNLDIFDTLDDIQSNIKNINSELSDLKTIQIANIAMNVIDRFDSKVYNAKNDIIDPNVIYTHMAEWDKINGSLFNGLYIVAGRPAMGKGVHLTELACRMGKHYDIGIINGEMSNEQLLTRIGCNLLDVDNFLWKKNPKFITEEEQELVHQAMNETLNLKLHITEDRYIHNIANKIRLWVEKYNVKCVLADFLTIFKVSDEVGRYFTDTQKTNYVLDVFVTLCRQLKIPIILYVQMNREILGRTGSKEPNLGDLKSSGSIEELAYQVSFLHRPEYYDKDSITDENGENIKDLCYQIISKHRDGEIGRIKHRAILKCSQMKEWNSNELTNWKPIKDVPF